MQLNLQPFLVRLNIRQRDHPGIITEVEVGVGEILVQILPRVSYNRYQLQHGKLTFNIILLPDDEWSCLPSDDGHLFILLVLMVIHIKISIRHFCSHFIKMSFHSPVPLLYSGHHSLILHSIGSCRTVLTSIRMNL